ncbi:MAG: MurR/RpiR family transcriptional regulator [Paracoccaceae bacterium]
MTAPLAPPPIPANPPDTLAQLRALMLAIARGESAISLGPKARDALGRILDLTGSPALLSITALAEVLGVNPSTLTRLAHSLGYTGFPAFQKVLLSASMAMAGDFYSRQAQAALASGSNTTSRAAQLCRENQANIDRFVEQFDAKAFDTAVDLIMSAPRVAVYGIRQFHALAAFLVYGLRMIRSDVMLLDANSLGLAEGLALLTPKDAFISASCAPYSRQVIEMAEVAQGLGLSTVAITDRTSSPLVGSSRAAILVNHDSSFISNSIGAFMVAAECLINACATAQPDQTRKALIERDRMIKALKIES